MAQSLIGSLRVSLGLDSAQFDKGIKDTRQKLADTGRKMRNIGAGMSVAITAPLALAAKDAVALFNTQDAAMTKVRQGIESTGGVAGKTADELFSMASALQEATTFGDEAILEGVTAQLLTFTNIAGDQFDRTQQAALDLATVLGSDLKSTTIQLGKALNDPVANLGALGRAGIQFSEEQETLIKSLAETGRLAEAQSIILDELGKQYGGQAAAAAGTFGGQQQQLANSFGDLKEEIGAIVAEFLPPLVDGLKRLVTFLQGVNPETKKMGVILAGVAAVIGPLVGTIGLFAIGISAISAPILAVGAGIGAATAAFIAFKPEIVAAKDAVVQFGQDALEYIKGLPAEILQAFKDLPAQMLRIGGDIMTGLRDGIANKVSSVKDAVTGAASGAVDAIKGRLGIQSPSKVFREIGQFLMDGLRIGIDDNAGTVTAATDDMAGRIGGAFDGMFSDVLRGQQSFGDALKSGMDRIADNLISGGISKLSGALGGIFSGGPSRGAGGAIAGALGSVLASFDGGGYTGNGPRAGGLDGRGGYLAMVHPQETVIDHAKGGAMPQGRIQVEVLGGDLSLTDDGQLMQRVRVVARQEGEGAAGRSAKAQQRSMKYGRKDQWGL